MAIIPEGNLREYENHVFDYAESERDVKDVYYDSSTSATAFEMIKELLFELRVPSSAQRDISGPDPLCNVIELKSDKNKIRLVFDQQTNQLKKLTKTLLSSEEQEDSAEYLGQISQEVFKL